MPSGTPGLMVVTGSGSVFMMAYSTAISYSPPKGRPPVSIS
ncbi:MAG: hypothetical protein KatS3mg042_0639 [Rhodothermaceae bacterium]|nr:MAG: hypothetical protein KatS3mg042_0639 [Rhodothermaceae bacterium]